MASGGETTPFDAVDKLGGSGVGHAHHVGELADRDGPRLTEHEEKPQLTERQVVMGPIGRPLRHEPTQRPNVSVDIVESNGMS